MPRSNPDPHTPRAVRALKLARDEAAHLNAPQPGTPHLLLGLLAEAEGIAGQVLAHQGIAIDQVRTAAADLSTNTPAGAFDQAIQRAEQEAHNLSHTYVGTEHLLLALLHEPEGAALAILNKLGANPPAIEAEVRITLSLAPGTYVIRGPKDNVVSCRVDDIALSSIDALVESGIRSTRSDAAAWLIGAGIEANREFFTQVDATVAEIRRLREKAQALARQTP